MNMSCGRAPLRAPLFLAAALALLAACSPRTDPAPPAASIAAPAAPASALPAADNRLVQLLQGAEIQAETDAQRAELRRALQDLRDKPPAELAAARYAGLDGTPGQRSLAEVLRAHVVPAQPVEMLLDELIAGREGAAGRAALDATIARVGAPAK
jgi:hypothetical protein